MKRGAGTARVVDVNEERRASGDLSQSIRAGRLPPRPRLMALLVPPADGHDDGADQRNDPDSPEDSVDVLSKEVHPGHLDPCAIRQRR